MTAISTFSAGIRSNATHKRAKLGSSAAENGRCGVSVLVGFQPSEPFARLLSPWPLARSVQLGFAVSTEKSCDEPKELDAGFAWSIRRAVRIWTRNIGLESIAPSGLTPRNPHSGHAVRPKKESPYQAIIAKGKSPWTPFLVRECW